MVSYAQYINSHVQFNRTDSYQNVINLMPKVFCRHLICLAYTEYLRLFVGFIIVWTFSRLYLLAGSIHIELSILY